LLGVRHIFFIKKLYPPTAKAEATPKKKENPQPCQNSAYPETTTPKTMLQIYPAFSTTAAMPEKDSLIAAGEIAHCRGQYGTILRPHVLN